MEAVLPAICRAPNIRLIKVYPVQDGSELIKWAIYSVVGKEEQTGICRWKATRSHGVPPSGEVVAKIPAYHDVHGPFANPCEIRRCEASRVTNENDIETLRTKGIDIGAGMTADLTMLVEMRKYHNGRANQRRSVMAPLA